MVLLDHKIIDTATLHAMLCLYINFLTLCDVPFPYTFLATPKLDMRATKNLNLLYRQQLPYANRLGWATMH